MACGSLSSAPWPVTLRHWRTETVRRDGAAEDPSGLAATMRAMIDMPSEERAATGARGRDVREMDSTAMSERLERMLSTTARRMRR
jgi:hypothetical protein